ncbi:hypothetical protein RDWZM_006186 [Blomia tropicalis]|uniref:Uncharacterized protein n=1 Tax=Blomia tropicalis TaxID=40697 RepID=A0A9Q0RN28_BLOTA|nr:hypothetical protein RDWZM_006186 [Blomia tropicalis]
MMNFIKRQYINSRIYRCTYQMMKEMINDHGTRKARIRYKINLFTFIYGSIRMITSTVVIMNNFEIDPRFPYNITRDDALNTYFMQTINRYGKEFPLMMLALALLNFIVQDAMYRLDVDKNVWRWWYQLVVVNQDNYYQFYSEFYPTIENKKTIEITNSLQQKQIARFVPKFMVNAYIRLVSEYSIHIGLHNLEKKSFFNKKLIILSNLSNELRSLIVNFLIGFDYFSWFIQIAAYIATFVVYLVAALTMDLSGLAWYGYVTINLEMILCLHIALCIYQSGLFFAMCIFASSAYPGHVIQTNQKTLKHIRECRLKMPLSPYVSWRNRSTIKNQLQEHNIVTSLLISGSRELFGKLLYVFFLINVPINVYLIRRNLYKQQEFIDKLMLSLIAFFQLLVSLVIYLPLAYGNSVYHSPAKYIPFLQTMLRGRKGWLWYKMKYEDLYHRLVDNGPKLAISIGPVRAITYMAFCEVF